VSDVAEKRLEKALDVLFTHVEDLGQNRLVNDIIPVMDAMGALQSNDNGAMALLEECLASLEASKLSVIASVVGIGNPTKEFFENLDFAERKIAVAMQFIGNLRSAGEVNRIKAQRPGL
jgi:hypothetical protein